MANNIFLLAFSFLFVLTICALPRYKHPSNCFEFFPELLAQLMAKTCYYVTRRGGKLIVCERRGNKGREGNSKNVSESKLVTVRERVFIPKSHQTEPPEQEQLLWLRVD